MGTDEPAKQYNVTERTIRNWRKKNAPFADAAAMEVFIKAQRDRRGVSKFFKKSAAIVAEVLPPLAEVASPISEPQVDSTLTRLTEAERIAYGRYVASGGDERYAQIWLMVADQKRKLESETAKLGTDATEAETKLVAATIEVLNTLHTHLSMLPKLMGLMCEMCERDDITAKIEGHLDRTLKHAIGELWETVINGTPLAQVYSEAGKL